MSRPKKPLGQQEGHLTKQQQVEKKLQEELVKANSDQLKVSPKWLVDKVAKDEWSRLVKLFESLSVISNLDFNNLGGYCNSYSLYLKATKELKSQKLTIEYTNKGGQVNLQENPLIKIQIKYSDEMKRYAALLGLTIDSRLKIATLKLDNVKNEVKDEFGDI